MSAVAFIATRVITPVTPVAYVELTHNLPVEPGVFFITQFVRDVAAPDTVVVTRNKLRFPLSAINSSASYKLLALKIQNGIAEGVWWVDNYVYNPGQVNITFTSQGQGGGGGGDPKSFSGRTEVAGVPAARRVVAVGLDGDAPQLLAETQSDPVTGQYTLNWEGYTGQILVTALDDYGVPHVEGEARGVGERIHPSSPTGYVYQVSAPGVLGPEPVWPTADGEPVTSGTVQMTAVPFYRPKSAGPFTIS